MTGAFYNEIEPYAAQWLENLVTAGHIADGYVERRSIADLGADDVRAHRQAHFFAGIGGWSYALRLAGWADDVPVWTGSCPCQPFSAAGRRGGFSDDRHLWPVWFNLIRECAPPIVFGEQVASPDGLKWLDTVRADLESAGYAFGASDLCAAGVGAPHIRQRLYFVAIADGERRERLRVQLRERGPQPTLPEARGSGASGFLGDARLTRAGWNAGTVSGAQGESSSERFAVGHLVDRAIATGAASELADANGARRGTRRSGEAGDGRDEARIEPARFRSPDEPWRDVEWVPCADGKARPIEPVAQSMADGLPRSLGRVGPEILQEAEMIVNADQTLAREALWHVRDALIAEAISRSAGGSNGVQEARILLAFLCQLAEQGWNVAKGVPCSRAEVSDALLRMLRGEHVPSRSPRRRGLAEQRPEQFTDAVQVLSSLLARCAQQAWGEALQARAASKHPLIVGADARMGRLRGYGNAIVPQVAATFIRAVMEIL